MEKSLHAFKHEWFSHPEWWFETRMETDKYLTETYGHWLTESMMEHSTDWTKDTVLTWIILYDQLPRHMARVSAEYKPLIYRCLAKAIGLVQWVMQEGFELGDYRGTEFGFLMLPMRHSYDTRLAFQVMKLTWAKMEADKSAGNHRYIEELKPFLVATYKRCPPLPLEPVEYRDYIQWIPAGEPNACPAFQWEKHAAVIAYSPEFLLEGEGLTTPPKWATGFGLSPMSGTVFVSLSGGVDSMVLLWVLKTYYPSIPVVAVYINYCNRSDAEEAFVADWCASRGVSLFIRRFREIQRAPAMAFELRELYESYTKRGRFHAYHLASGVVSNALPSSSAITVAFGHNQDDCFENILTNICQKKKYDNLRGMETLMETDGVQCWRPLLHVSKEEIYHFAQQRNIPYLQDSTPKWSCRGKIRDIVRPTLQQYHAAMIPAFFHLSDTLGQLTEHLEHTASVLHRKTSPEGVLTISPEDYPASLWTSLPFWQRYFLKLWGFTPSHKSLLHFTERLQKPVVSNETLRVLLKKGIPATVKRSATEWVFEFQFNAVASPTAPS